MDSPIQIALEAKAQALSVPKTSAQMLWAQAGILSATNMKMSMDEVMDFINGSIQARADIIEGEMNRATHPFLWPFSTQTETTLYPDLTADEKTRVRERQMSQCVEALRLFVLGDIFTQASDARAIQKLGDGKPGSIGEAGTMLKSATGSLDPVMKAYGSRDTSGAPTGGANMTVTTHQTNPVFPDLASVEGLPWYPWCRP